MVLFDRELIFDFFDDGFINVTPGAVAQGRIERVRLFRNDDLDINLELIFPEDPGYREVHRAGTVRAASETIEFGLVGGGAGIARGVSHRETQRRMGRTESKSETSETFRIASVEIDFQRSVQSSFVVETVSNLPTDFLFPDPFSEKAIKTTSYSMGVGEEKTEWSITSNSFGGGRSLYINVGCAECYVIPPSKRNDKLKNSGRILYKGCPDHALREKIRNCLSFTLGRPLVFLGYTEYCEQWKPNFVKSFSAFSLSGRAFKLPTMPPYPINDGRNVSVVDGKLVSVAIKALLAFYEKVKLNELLWSYWFAACAPVHLGAANFGSLIEQLQANSKDAFSSVDRKLLPEETWRDLKKHILLKIRSVEADSDLVNILMSKVSLLNDAPQRLILKRLFDELAIEMSDAESDAWRHRNAAAHGSSYGDPIQTILKTKLLRLLFHRLIGKMTGCSDRYTDYYNFDHPVRLLEQAVPER